MIYHKYGKCAIKAYELVLNNVEPREAWQKAANEIFGNNSSQAKSLEIIAVKQKRLVLELLF